MRIGKIELAQPFCQAGLAGYSDRAMRTVARGLGCPYAVTEAMLDVIMLNGGEGLRKSIDISDEDHPVAGQIMGSDPDTMARAAVIMHRAGYDVIDLNFACPVKKIKNKARGGHMLMDVPRGVSILKAVRDALPPDAITTISTRRGFDDSTESVDRFYQIMESAWANGYAAARVHGRTVEQKYLGQAHWPFLREVKRQYPDHTILGSGDVFTAYDVVRMLDETGVDIVWIARGAIGNPWIFRDAAKLLAGRYASGAPTLDGPARSGGVDFVGSAPRTAFPIAGELVRSADPTRSVHRHLEPPTIQEQREALARHFGIAMQIHGEQLAGRRMRKMGIKYSRFHPQHGQVKTEFIAVKSLRDWTNVLDKWYRGEGPGAWPDPKAADEVNQSADMQTCEAGV